MFSADAATCLLCQLRRSKVTALFTPHCNERILQGGTKERLVGSDCVFYVCALNHRPGENFELRADLNSEYRDKRKDAIKRVIANMTVGKGACKIPIIQARDCAAVITKGALS